MQTIRNVDIYVDGNNNLILNKKKSKRVFDILVLLLLPVSFATLILYKLMEKKGGLNDAWLALGILCFGFLVMLIIIGYKIKRSLISNKNYILKNLNGQVVVNGKVFCSGLDLDSISIQTSIDRNGSRHYNVGLSSKGEFLPLILYLPKEDAEKIGSIVGHYFDRHIQHSDSKLWIE